jgi:two-component system, chemotaxis family, protein-glutamate methylesterase/glutaminase
MAKRRRCRALPGKGSAAYISVLFQQRTVFCQTGTVHGRDEVEATKDTVMKNRDIIVITASIGDFEALKQLVAAWASDLPASVFVVLHGNARPDNLLQLLQNECALPVKQAEHQDKIQRSVVYVAPPDRHLLIQEGEIILSVGPKENSARPAADPLFRSAATHYGSRVIGIALTIDLDDGVAGLQLIQSCGGVAVVQEPAECPASRISRNALRAVKDVVVVPLALLGWTIMQMVETPATAVILKNEEAQSAADIDTRIALTGMSDPTVLHSIGKPSDLTCPDCGGVVWTIGAGAPIRYRCHTGHAFSGVSLADAQRLKCEDALWSVARGLQERVSLSNVLLATAEPDQTAELKARIKQLDAAKDTVLNLLPKI